MLNNSQGSQGNNDLQTAQNAIAILIDQISKARGVGRTIVIDKNWLLFVGCIAKSVRSRVNPFPGLLIVILQYPKEIPIFAPTN